MEKSERNQLTAATGAGSFAAVMRRTFLSLIAVAVCALAMAQTRAVRVGILRERAVERIVVLSAGGGYNIMADGKKVGELLSNDGLRVEAVGGKLQAKSLAASFTAHYIELVQKVPLSNFRLKVLDSKLAERTYPGHLRIDRSRSSAVQRNAGGTRLLLTNHVGMEDYTAGVIQSEAGKDHAAEFYKLQAVTCRTYALTNIRKHLPDGFEVCDAVHCQVYQGKTVNPDIIAAVAATEDMVLVDSRIRLIHATFHSNCGGETLNAEDVWSKSEPYLRAVPDSFCTHEPHAVWTKSIGTAEWLAYLRKKWKVNTLDTVANAAVLNMEPQRRNFFLPNVIPSVPLEDVRHDWKLNSGFFAIRTEGDKVIMEGRGFGHGVGLCQEGAMHMARAGMDYTHILHHYYTDVHLVDLSALDFFRDETAVPQVPAMNTAPARFEGR